MGTESVKSKIPVQCSPKKYMSVPYLSRGFQVQGPAAEPPPPQTPVLGGLITGERDEGATSSVAVLLEIIGTAI